MNSGISEAEQLSEKLDKLTSDAPNVNVLEELCPACNAIIPFTDPTTAVCAQGHHWRTCSLHSQTRRLESYIKLILLSSSTLLDYLLHPRNTHDPHLHQLHQESLLTAPYKRLRRVLASSGCKELAGRRRSGRSAQVFVLR